MGQGKMDMLKHAVEKLGLHVTDTEICAFGQSRLLRQLAPGDYVLIDNTGVAGNKTNLHHIVSKCFGEQWSSLW
ncbi:hypothetical protein [Neobacillus fumarioli]|uniref:hypothetical protein n=1 Tax=Neobacillus fumarioli TaxID=105229 RepID=UPI000836959F|nr:hypothetical protein [Neobacillus fumarioli]